MYAWDGFAAGVRRRCADGEVDRAAAASLRGQGAASYGVRSDASLAAGCEPGGVDGDRVFARCAHREVERAGADSGCRYADVCAVYLAMFQRKIRIEIVGVDGGVSACPVKGLDSFAMRNFTNDAVFDDTLPVGDGVMEAGHRVPLERLQAAM